MSDDPRLTIDFTREENVLAVLPRPPLINSNKLGWNGINVRRYPKGLLGAVEQW